MHLERVTAGTKLSRSQALLALIGDYPNFPISHSPQRTLRFRGWRAPSVATLVAFALRLGASPAPQGLSSAFVQSVLLPPHPLWHPPQLLIFFPLRLLLLLAQLTLTRKRNRAPVVMVVFAKTPPVAVDIVTLIRIAATQIVAAVC